jgi:two-component system nitrate/nitrite sensor histidine kinase NarX
MVMIEDDGIGIQNKIMEGGPGEHLGLNILQERATRIGGDLKIETEPGEGTRITLRFPVPEELSRSDDFVEIALPTRSTN